MHAKPTRARILIIAAALPTSHTARVAPGGARSKVLSANPEVATGYMDQTSHSTLSRQLGRFRPGARSMRMSEMLVFSFSPSISPNAIMGVYALTNRGPWKPSSTINRKRWKKGQHLVSPFECPFLALIGSASDALSSATGTADFAQVAVCNPAPRSSMKAMGPLQ